MKVLSLFTGIGAPEKALTNLGIPYTLAGFSEIDKYAISSYCAIHGISSNLNFGDITKIDLSQLPHDIDLITQGSPCTDFSVAGKGAGGDMGSGTRSSLLWDTIKIIEHCKAKYVLWENVKNVLSKNHRHNFDKYLATMDELGYNNYYKVLNAKDFSIPQNRERVFVLSIRKDIDTGYDFPVGQDNGIRLKDILETEVDEKYYINSEKAKELIKQYKGDLAIGSNIRSREFEGQGWKDNCPCLCARDYKDPKNIILPVITQDRIEKRQNGRRFKDDGEPMFTLTVQDRHGVLEVYPNEITLVGKLEDIKGHEHLKKVYDEEGISPCLDSMQGGNRHPKILTQNSLEYVGSIGNKDIVGDGKNLSRNAPQGNRVYSSEGIATAQTSNGGGIGGPTGLYIEPTYRIRKLTPKECYRLMGFTDSDYDRAASCCSATQLYKQAGNSIVVNVLEAIFKNLFS